MENAIKCKRCGKCCHYLKDGILKKCKYLIVHSNRLTSCRIYASRCGTLIDVGIHCVMRIASPYDYENCPYNSGKEKPKYPIS